jgi:kynurenine formamidase
LRLKGRCARIGRPFGFTLAVFPTKWVGTTAAPVRAVAIVEDDAPFG